MFNESKQFYELKKFDVEELILKARFLYHYTKACELCLQHFKVVLIIFTMTLKGPTTLIEPTLAPLNLFFNFCFKYIFWNLFNTSFLLNLLKNQC